MPLIRLIYSSRSAIQSRGVDKLRAVHEIVATARNRNAELNITGFLMFDRDQFHQILEGSTAAVDALFLRIMRDDRHQDVQMLSRVGISKRRFQDWSMAAYLPQDDDWNKLRRHGIRNRHPISAETLLNVARVFTSSGEACGGAAAVG